jgi:membrane protein required for colicin V production
VDVALQPYDFLMLAVLVLCTVFGAWKGMAWQVAALASVIVSAGVAVHGSRPLTPFVPLEEPWNRFVAMLALYLITALGVWLLFRLVAGIIDRVKLKEFDRQVGAMFGAAKGVLLCLVITFFTVTLSETARQSVLRSRSGYYTALLIQRARPVLPEDVRNVFGKYIEELDRRLAPEDLAPPSGGPAEADALEVRTASTASEQPQ